MSVSDIAKQIEFKIREIDQIRAEIKNRGREKARTASIYDMEVAKVLVGLENGKEYELDGQKIKDPAKSVMDKLARGICFDYKLEMDVSEAEYKSVISNLEAVKTQVNALQSIYRHLD